MKKIFISNLRLLAEFTRDPVPGREKPWHSDSLRETINANFDSVRSLADAVRPSEDSRTECVATLARRLQSQSLDDQISCQNNALLLTSRALTHLCLTNKEMMDRKAKQRKDAIFATGSLFFLGVVIMMLLWALGML
jgi:hypothetical protein